MRPGLAIIGLCNRPDWLLSKNIFMIFRLTGLKFSGILLCQDYGVRLLLLYGAINTVQN
jgi:hypothetical protein